MNRPTGSTDGSGKDRWDSPRIKHLIEQILPLVIEKGFHETSVRDIAAAAGWNMATLYRYIDDKRDILFFIQQWIHEQFGEYLATCLKPAPDATSGLQQLIDCYYRAMHKHARHLRFLLRERSNFKPEHRASSLEDSLSRVNEFRALIEQGINSGEFRAVNAEMAARQIYFGSWAWAINAPLVESGGGFEQYLAYTRAFILDGLRSRPESAQAATQATASG